MKTEKIILKNETGLHARPASELVKVASKFKSNVNFVIDGKQINAKSVLALMAAGVKTNTEIEIICDGEDEEIALLEIIQRFNLLGEE